MTRITPTNPPRPPSRGLTGTIGVPGHARDGSRPR